MQLNDQSVKELVALLPYLYNVLFNYSLPDGIQEQNILQLDQFNEHARYLAARVGHEMGIDSSINISRKIATFIEDIEIPDANDQEVKITRDTFNGVPVVIHTPTKHSNISRPGLVFFHGGGFMYRTPRKYLHQTVHLAKHLNAVVISVDYRLTPEYPFPASLYDCLQATLYFMANTNRYFVNPNRICVIGDSAGANIAASVSQTIRDRKHLMPKTQVLIYPSVQMIDWDTPSFQQNDLPVLSKNAMVDFLIAYTGLDSTYAPIILSNRHICEDIKKSIYSSYLNLQTIPMKYHQGYIKKELFCDPIVAKEVTKIMLNPMIFPLMAETLSNLPSALIITGEFDILRDDGLMYGYRLRKDGVEVEERLIKGGFHRMFDMLDRMKIGNEILILYCCVFTLISFANGIKEHKSVYDKSGQSEVLLEDNKDLLKCLVNFFNQLFITSAEEETVEQEIIRTDKLYQNSLCVLKSIKSSEALARSLGKFFESIMNLKDPKMEEKTKSEKRKIKQDIYQNALEISSALRKDKKIFSSLRRIITSFLENSELPEGMETNDEVSKLLSKNLLSCTAYHFNATFQFNLTKEIKQQDKLLELLLKWNAGCITITTERSKRVLNCLASLFNTMFNFSPSTSTKQQKEFYGIVQDIVDDIGFNFEENATVTGYRFILELIDRIESPEPKDPDVKITRTTFDGIPVIIQEPTKRSSKARPALMFFHGGGWVYRSAAKYLPQTVYLTKHVEAVVISVEYRQSPEYTFPIPVDDCLRATKYLMKNAKKFNVDPKRIAVLGDSAGGNMAASVSLMMRDKKLRQPKVQVLIYPCIQMFDFDLPSYQKNKEMFGLYAIEMVEFYLQYAGLNRSFIEPIFNNKHICDDMKHSPQSSYLEMDAIPIKYRKNYIRNETDCDPILAEEVQEAMLNPYIFPLMSDDLTNLPPALIINNEFDILRDEGLMYGSRLRKAGVLLEEQLIEGGYHGTIDMLDIVDIGKEVMDIIVDYLKKNL